MQITVRCPKCETKYHLDPELRGQRMRCPNVQCRTVFEVKPVEEGEEPPRRSEGSTAGPAAPVVKHSSGTVGDLVPILPAEAAPEDEAEVEFDELPPADSALIRPLPPKDEGPKPPRGSGNVGEVVPMLPAEASPPSEAKGGASGSEISGVPLRSAESASPAERSWEQPPPPRRVNPTPSPPPPPSPRSPSKPAAAQAEAVPPKKEAGTPLPKAPPPKPQPKAPPAPNWQAAPPPVRRGGATAPPRETQTIAPGDTSTTRPVVGDGPPAEHLAPREAAWDAPPDRHSDADDDTGHPPARHGSLKWLVVIVLLLAAVVGGFGWFIVKMDSNSETERFKKGLAEYQGGRNDAASTIFNELIRDFPESDELSTYKFLHAWSTLRYRLYRLGADPAEGLRDLTRFVKNEAKDPNLEKYREDVGAAYDQLLNELMKNEQEALKGENLEVLDEELENATAWVPGNRIKELKAQLGNVRQAIAHKLLREEILKVLDGLAGQPVPDMLERAAEEIARAKPELPGLERDGEVQKRMTALLEARRKLVTWHASAAPLEAAGEDGEPGLWVTADSGENTVPAAADRGGIVFALARGVLYALDQGTGQVRWATRVGVDTTTLPVRIPASATEVELALVLSSDTNTLTAREARTGKPRWRHRLSAPCLGRPLVVGARLYLPTYDGRVYEFDLANREQLGWFELGKPLSVGGTRQEGTSLIYFAADERYVFVIDVDPDKRPSEVCPGILISNHPAGSLRSEPVIVSRADQRMVFHLEESAWPDYLVLSQASGLDAMKLRVFTLPISGGFSTGTLGPEPEVPGWSWFPPFQNFERLVQVTDEGVVGLIGINQVRNMDKDLYLELKHQIPPPAGKREVRTGRGQVVHASENEVWVLAHGDLRLWHFDRFGQNLVPLWQQPLTLGSPLHASQVNEGKSLVMVTQSPAEPTCKATAVSAAADGDMAVVRWQKQLGLLARGEPIAVGGQVLMLDQSGALFQFDPKEHADAANGWQAGGKRIAATLAPSSRGPYLLPNEDGSSVDILALGPTGRLVVRSFEPGKPVSNRSYGSFGLPAGAPARVGKAVIVPMDTGLLVRLPLTGKAGGTRGPEWRAPYADRDASGFVAALGGDEFVATDGSRGLARWKWSGERDFTQSTTSTMLPARLTAAPVVLPREKGGDVLVCVADSRGMVTLLKDTPAGAREQSWQTERSWSVGGRITAGPFLRGKHVGCVVDRHRLVWIDPSKNGLAWEFADQRAGIIGIPNAVNGALIVALQSGKFIGLDAQTGKPKGSGNRLKAHVAPTAAPVPFGEGRVLAPLSDGTLMILTSKQLGL